MPTAWRAPLVSVFLSTFLGVCTVCACTPHIDSLRLETPGDYEAAFEHGGIARTMLLHVSPGDTGSPDRAAPKALVVALHGGGSSGEGMAEATGFSELADREGFVVVYPEAVAIAHGMWRIWNTGDCFAPACLLGVDDMGMVPALIDVLRDRLAIDPARVYLVGYSNGGSLAFSIAARESERFAGLAVFGATMTADGPVIGPQLREPMPRLPLSVMTIHSELNPYIPRDGAEGLSRTEVSQAHLGQFWAAAAACDHARRYLSVKGVARVTHYQRCEQGTEVKQLELSGWDHEWPGRENLVCKPPDDPLRRFDAAETIWRFLKDKRRG